MAFNDFSDRGKPDSMIGGCALSGEECFSFLKGQPVISVFNLQKVHIASGFACDENAAHPLLLAAARSDSEKKGQILSPIDDFLLRPGF